MKRFKFKYWKNAFGTRYSVLKCPYCDPKSFESFKGYIPPLTAAVRHMETYHIRNVSVIVER